MAQKTILFVVLFACFAFGGLVQPIFGIMGYMLHYIIGPERQWWHAPLSSLGIRYSFTLAAITALGIALNHGQLKFKKVLVGQEKLAMLMLALIWFLVLFGPETTGRYISVDHASIKMTKVIIFCLMMTHVVTLPKDLDKVFWVLISGSLILGLQAYDVPRRAFSNGRLNAVVGGSDFFEANALAGFMVAGVIITGVMFLRTKLWGKLLCAITGVFSMNTIILCRSRSALVALFCGSFALVITAPKKYRVKLLVCLVIAATGMFILSDPQFLIRMKKITTHADSIVEGLESTDRSTMMRIEAWRGGIQMIKDHPFGVGPGNFNQNIGRYAPSIDGLSPHSTYIQAGAELGLPGLALLILILANAMWMMRNITIKSKQLTGSAQSDFQWSACGLSGVIASYASFGLTGHLMYSEIFWWCLMLPVCLLRAFENTQEGLLVPESSLQIEQNVIESKEFEK